MISEEAIARLKRVLLDEFFSTRVEDRVLYAGDGTSRTDLRPDAVAFPASAGQVSDVIKIARQFGIPVIPRGAGSGLTGGALPVKGGIVLAMTRMNRIIEIDPANLLAIAEPGVVTAALQKAAENQGLFYPPDPASRDFSTIGGNAAENAGGTRAVKYGVTRDYILGLEVVLGTGEIINTGVRTVKGVVGYDLTRLIVGSEGTLGVITRLILRLVPAPPWRETISAHFADLDSAGRTVSALTKARIVPATVEFMDRASIDCVTGYLGLEIGREVGAMLLIETDGPEVQARAEAEAVTAICRENGALEVRRAETAKEAEDLWIARRALSPAINQTATGKANEDVVVPRSAIPEMVAKTREISRRTGVPIVNFGHAGDGNIHVNVMYEAGDEAEVKKAEKAVAEIFQAALDLGGTISGEHGIGTTKKDFIGMELDGATLDLMRRIKTAFDPDGIMNPGKIFPS